MTPQKDVVKLSILTAFLYYVNFKRTINHEAFVFVCLFVCSGVKPNFSIVRLPSNWT